MTADPDRSMGIWQWQYNPNEVTIVGSFVSVFVIDRHLVKRRVEIQDYKKRASYQIL